MSKFKSVSLKQIALMIADAPDSLKDDYVTEALAELEPRAKRAEERGQEGKAKRTRKAIEQLRDMGSVDHANCFAVLTAEPKAKPKPKALSRMTKADLIDYIETLKSAV